MKIRATSLRFNITLSVVFDFNISNSSFGKIFFKSKTNFEILLNTFKNFFQSFGNDISNCLKKFD